MAKSAAEIRRERGQDTLGPRPSFREPPSMSTADQVALLIRCATGGVGLLILLLGTGLAVTLFAFIKGLIDEPERLADYLDRWEGAMAVQAEPAPETAEPFEASPVDGSEEPSEIEPEIAREPISRRTASEEESALQIFARLLESSNLSRPVGALVILLLLGVMARLSLGLITAGSRVGLAAASFKKEKPEAETSSSRRG